MNTSGNSPLAGLTDEHYDEVMGIFIGEKTDDSDIDEILTMVDEHIEKCLDADGVTSSKEEVRNSVSHLLDISAQHGIIRHDLLKIVVKNATDTATLLEVIDDVEYRLKESSYNFNSNEHGEIFDMINNLAFVAESGYEEIQSRIIRILLDCIKAGVSFNVVKSHLFKVIEKINDPEIYKEVLTLAEGCDIDIAVKMIQTPHFSGKQYWDEFHRYLFERFSIPQTKQSSMRVFHQVVTAEVPKYNEEDIKKIYTELASHTQDIEVLEAIGKYCANAPKINYVILERLIENNSLPIKFVHSIMDKIPTDLFPKIIDRSSDSLVTIDFVLDEMPSREFEVGVYSKILMVFEKRVGAVPICMINKLSDRMTRDNNFLEYPGLERRLRELINQQKKLLDDTTERFEKQKKEKTGGGIKGFIYNWKNRRYLKASKNDGF